MHRERYALLPYLYTLFRHANTDGLPIMRPMWYEYPRLEAGFDVDDQFLLGQAILVAPVLEAGATSRSILFPPSDRWFDAHSGLEIATGGSPTVCNPGLAMPVVYLETCFMSWIRGAFCSGEVGHEADGRW
jgi:alpha-glucosidase (family GH31 glycosyl hydrolase)